MKTLFSLCLLTLAVSVFAQPDIPAVKGAPVAPTKISCRKIVAGVAQPITFTLEQTPAGQGNPWTAVLSATPEFKMTGMLCRFNEGDQRLFYCQGTRTTPHRATSSRVTVETPDINDVNNLASSAYFRLTLFNSTTQKPGAKPGVTKTEEFSQKNCVAE